MGASNSHEYDAANSTPVRLTQSRVLSIDPRSPSSSINRTPIIVGKTPEGVLDPRSPSVDITRTPLGQIPEPLDPRSPTVGIVRTPLTTVTQAQIDNAMDTEETTRNDVPKLDLSMDTSTPVEPELDDQEEVEGEALLEPLHVSDLNLEDPPTCESTRLVAKDTGAGDTKSSGEVSKPRKKKKSKIQSKELFPGSKKSSIPIPTTATTGLKDVTRSPLATRTYDMNSPLKLVQRKQMKEIDLKRGCSLESSRSHFIVKDKENM